MPKPVMLAVAAFICVASVAAFQRSAVPARSSIISVSEALAAMQVLEANPDDLSLVCTESADPVMCDWAMQSLLVRRGLHSIRMIGPLLGLPSGDVIATFSGLDDVGLAHEGRVEFFRNENGKVQAINPIFWGDLQLTTS